MAINIADRFELQKRLEKAELQVKGRGGAGGGAEGQKRRPFELCSMPDMPHCTVCVCVCVCCVCVCVCVCVRVCVCVCVCVYNPGFM